MSCLLLGMDPFHHKNRGVLELKDTQGLLSIVYTYGNVALGRWSDWPRVRQKVKGLELEPMFSDSHA